MTKIRKVYDDKILPDGSRTEFYPITSTKAVYTTNNLTIHHILDEGYRFGGVIEPTDVVPFTDQRVFYGATKSGTYTSCGNLTVDSGEAAFLMYSTEEGWRKAPFGSTDISSVFEELREELLALVEDFAEQIDALEDEVDDFKEDVTEDIAQFKEDVEEDIAAFKEEVLKALEDNERVIANALVRHEQQLEPTQDTQ